MSLSPYRLFRPIWYLFHLFIYFNPRIMTYRHGNEDSKVCISVRISRGNRFITIVWHVISTEARSVSDRQLERRSVSGEHGVCRRVWPWQWLHRCRQVLWSRLQQNMRPANAQSVTSMQLPFTCPIYATNQTCALSTIIINVMAPNLPVFCAVKKLLTYLACLANLTH